MTTKLVLLDRDGVINQDLPQGVLNLKQLDILPNAGKAIRMFNDAGFRVAVVTNQSAIGRNLLDEPTLHRIHRAIAERIKPDGAVIQQFYFCADHPDNATARRKPASGMLIEALTDFNATPSLTPMVGDALTDMEAAYRAGCPRYLVRTGKGSTINEADIPQHLQPVTICESILQAATIIIERYR